MYVQWDYNNSIISSRPLGISGMYLLDHYSFDSVGLFKPNFREQHCCLESGICIEICNIISLVALLLSKSENGFYGVHASFLLN